MSIAESVRKSLKSISASLETDLLTNLPVKNIEPDPNQDRTISNYEQKLEELTISIQSKGIKQPIEVYEINTGNYRIISGEMRWQAAVELQLESIPSIIRKTYKDIDISDAQFLENVPRAALNPMDIAKAIKKRIEQFDLKKHEVAKMAGKHPTWVSRHLKLLESPLEVQELATKGIRKDLETLLVLSNLQEEDRVREINNIIIGDSVSVSYLKSLLPSNQQKNSAEIDSVEINVVENNSIVKPVTENKIEPKKKNVVFNIPSVELLVKIINKTTYGTLLSQDQPDWHIAPDNKLLEIFHSFKDWALNE